MIDYDFKNQIVEDNVLIGGPTLKPFKMIIKKVLYPEFDDQKLSLVEDALEGYQIMGGSQEGVLELSVYAVECAVYYILDMCDIEPEFYEYTVNKFDTVIQLLSTIDKKLLMQFKPRLEILIGIARGDEYGYGDQIQAKWKIAFGQAQ